MISIILPAYNCENTIEECINSVLAQTYTDWELIIVNDGSKDNTKELCEHIARRDNRVLVFSSTKNEGVVKARNYALKKAQGEYVAFIDSDDQYSSDMLEKMVNTAMEKDCDIVVCGYYERYSDCSLIQKRPSAHGMKSERQFFPMLFENGILGFLWNKVYRKSMLLEGEYSFDLNVCEDLYLNCKLLMQSRKIYVLQDCLYYYYMNPDSVTHNMDKLIDKQGNWKYLLAYKNIEKLFHNNKVFLHTVQASTVWIIKLGIEELSNDGAHYHERCILLKEMIQYFPICLLSENSIRFKVGYLRRMLWEICQLVVLRLRKTEV